MKIKYKIAVVTILLSLSAAGCQKENENYGEALIERATTFRNVTYFIDGVQHTTLIRSESEWQLFIGQMLALSREGCRIEIYNGNTYNSASMNKATETYQTSDEGDANRWIRNMEDQGYKAFVEYDKKTGIYTCTAVK